MGMHDYEAPILSAATRARLTRSLISQLRRAVVRKMLSSFAISIWLNLVDWTDLATIQTTWGSASYVVTSGAQQISPFLRMLHEARMVSKHW